MKNRILTLAGLCALLLLPASCQELFRQAPPGTLLINLRVPPLPETRAGGGMPDTGSFLITVTDASGQLLHESSYARCPEELSVPAGTYTVSASSGPFYEPAFDTPLWGDIQVVSVAAGGSLAVELVCSQCNSGLRLEVEESFRRSFPGGTLLLRTAEGDLPYPYDESRTAYFLPGTVSLLLDDGGYMHTLLSRALSAREVLSLRLGASMGRNSGGVSIQVDTVRSWLTESFVYGDADAGAKENAYDVATARTRPGEQGVWVRGYIVGVAVSSSRIEFEPPFSKNTNLVLGPRENSSDPERCLSVELRAGAIRDALNLQDNPGILGRAVYLRGDLVSAYYGIPGLKAPSEYVLD